MRSRKTVYSGHKYYAKVNLVVLSAHIMHIRSLSGARSCWRPLRINDYIQNIQSNREPFKWKFCDCRRYLCIIFQQNVSIYLFVWYFVHSLYTWVQNEGLFLHSFSVKTGKKPLKIRIVGIRRLWYGFGVHLCCTYATQMCIFKVQLRCKPICTCRLYI